MKSDPQPPRSRARRLGALALVAVGVASAVGLPADALAAQTRAKGRRAARARSAPQAPVTVTQIELALDDAGEPGEVVSEFRPADNPMHFVVRFFPARTGTVFEVKLWAVTVESGERDVVVGDLRYVTKPGENRLNVQFELPQDWPQGVWKLAVHADGRLVAEHQFRVAGLRRVPRGEPDDEVATAGFTPRR
jgi:hypothetical protein